MQQTRDNKVGLVDLDSTYMKTSAVITSEPKEMVMSTKGASRSLNDPLLADVSLPHSIVVYPLGFLVRVRTNDQRILEMLGKCWPNAGAAFSERELAFHICVTNHQSFECPPAPSAHARNGLVVFTADAQNHSVCDMDRGEATSWIAESTLEHELYLRYHLLEGPIYTLLCTSHVTAVHAACVSWEGVGVMLCGVSGAGKSSLAYACARAGWAYTSDDACYLPLSKPDTIVLGQSHRARFRPSAKELFPELEGRQLTPRAEGKPSIEIPINELPVERVSACAHVEYLVFLKRHLSPETELVPLSKGCARERLETANYPGEELRQRRSEAVDRLLSKPAFELCYRDLHSAESRLRSLTESKRERSA